MEPCPIPPRSPPGGSPATSGDVTTVLTSTASSALGPAVPERPAGIAAARPRARKQAQSEVSAHHGRQPISQYGRAGIGHEKRNTTSRTRRIFARTVTVGRLRSATTQPRSLARCRDRPRPGPQSPSVPIANENRLVLPDGLGIPPASGSAPARAKSCHEPAGSPGCYRAPAGCDNRWLWMLTCGICAISSRWPRS